MFYQKTQKLLEMSLWMQNAENGVSIADIMQKFNVSKRTIQFVCCPDKMMKCREQFIKARRAGKYKPTKEQWAETIREHRRYKQDLHVQGKI